MSDHLLRVNTKGEAFLGETLAEEGFSKAASLEHGLNEAALIGERPTWINARLTAVAVHATENCTLAVAGLTRVTIERRTPGAEAALEEVATFDFWLPAAALATAAQIAAPAGLVFPGGLILPLKVPNPRLIAKISTELATGRITVNASFAHN
jgi:hypothetical protein